MKKNFVYRTLFLALAAGLVLSGCEQGNEQADEPVTEPRPGAWTKAPGVPARMPGEIQTVCFGNGLFVAGSRENDGRIAYSSDGINWTGLDGDTTTFGTNFVHVRFLNGRFWAVGGGGHMAWSEDGAAWTGVANPGITLNIVDITYGDGVLVAVGDQGSMSYSTNNGETWTTNDQTEYFESSNVGGANFKAITWAAGKFLAAGQLCRAIYSTDGINWTDISETIAKDVFGLQEVPQNGTGWLGISVAAYGNGLYVVATQGLLGLSTDCETWEPVELSDAGFPRGHRWGWINSLIYAEGIFILGGGDGGTAWSTDARTWTRMDTNAIFHNFHFVNGLAYGGGKLIGVGATCTDPDCPNDPKSDREADHAGNAGCIAYTALE